MTTTFMKKIAINGFGRIGRASLKIALTKKNLKICAINDLGDLENLAYLLRYDSAQKKFDKSVRVSGSNLIVGKTKIPFYSIANPAKLPWKKLGIEVVLECTGVFKKEADVRKHIQAGAKQVILSAPVKGKGVATVVRGANEKDAQGKKLVANASCTTNCTAPIMSVLESAFGVEKALLTTVHAVTASQRTVDLASKKDWRRGRSVIGNIIPTTTGAAVATALTIPSLENKFDGISIRVPIVCGSLVDIVALLKKDVTENQINAAFKKFAKRPMYKGVLDVTEEELVSTDILGTTASAIVDLKFTKVVGGNLVKILAWYDNEWAYSNRLIEMVEKL
jgi:glyceraldehyde 3-phosphate dehydrogenase